MNVERTMEFILEQQAATAAQLGQVGERLDKLATRQEKTDRQLQAMKSLLKAGMKIMARNEERFKALEKRTDERFRETDERIRALTAAQERSDRRLDRTERNLDRLIQLWQGRGGNGRRR